MEVTELICLQFYGTRVFRWAFGSKLVICVQTHQISFKHLSLHTNLLTIFLCMPFSCSVTLDCLETLPNSAT